MNMIALYQKKLKESILDKMRSNFWKFFKYLEILIKMRFKNVFAKKEKKF
jgi:hypothetical protein